MTTLEQRIFDYKSKEGRAFRKPFIYGRIYEELFYKFINTEVSLLEIGIEQGGSLQLWKEYFGAKALIYGIDIRKEICYEEDQIKCFAGSQSNKEFLKTIPSLIPKIDILIDDGSHMCIDQIQTFEELFGHISKGGLYIVEDTHTSYREVYGGGYKKENTFIEYCKNIVDSLYKNTENIGLVSNLYWHFIESIHFFETLVAIKKK